MTYVNVLGIALAIGFLIGCFRLYLPAPRARTSAWAGVGFLILLAATGFDRSGFGLMRLGMMSGFLYFFCVWNQTRQIRPFHGLLPGLFLVLSTLGNLECLYQLVPWMAVSLVGWLWTRKPVFQKGVLTAGFSIVFLFSAQILFSFLPIRPFPETSLARQFYVLTYPELGRLGDSAPETEAETETKFEQIPTLAFFIPSKYWREGYRNLQEQPRKAFQNWRANINRMVFDFPATHATGIPTALGTGNAAFAPASLCLLFIMALYPYFRGRHRLAMEVHLILVWSLLGLGIRSLFSAGSDSLWPWVPALILMISLSFGLALPVHFRRENAKPFAVLG